jgi:hypothetical protein
MLISIHLPNAGSLERKGVASQGAKSLTAPQIVVCSKSLEAMKTIHPLLSKGCRGLEKVGNSFFAHASGGQRPFRRPLFCNLDYHTGNNTRIRDLVKGQGRKSHFGCYAPLVGLHIHLGLLDNCFPHLLFRAFIILGRRILCNVPCSATPVWAPKLVFISVFVCVCSCVLAIGN